jgi:hypothetical protein
MAHLTNLTGNAAHGFNLTGKSQGIINMTLLSSLPSDILPNRNWRAQDYDDVIHTHQPPRSENRMEEGKSEA